MAKGKLIDTVACKADNSQTYALYLPSYYSADKPFPCIYFYDAHARGAMPVRKYRAIAEKYGFVLIGSNVSKNGTQWLQTNEGVKTLMQDSRARINIDSKRIYTSGFSGGSRVASSIAIFDGGIAGVIGCSAGFPKLDQAIQNKFDYFGIVGDYDFNLAEMAQLDETLQQNGFMHQLLSFSGTHGWAPAPDFETALLWMQVNAMKEHIQPANDTLVKALKNDLDNRINSAISSGDLVKERQFLDGSVRILDGLIDISTYTKQLATLIAGAPYKKAVELQQQSAQEESNLQQDLAKQFPTQNEQWWANKIAELNKNIRSKTLQESNMNRRVLSYVGLLGYMYSDHAIKSGDLSNAEMFLKIFKLADPKNPDCSYLKAIYCINKGNPDMAIASLAEAASLGYNDLSQLLNEPAFMSMHEDERFKKLTNKIIENYRTN